jgi:hypothetical protein
MLNVGQDLFAMCGKCDAQWHVIVAMDAGKVTKVQCKQCMGYHRYRVAPGEVDVNRTATGRRTVAPAKARKNGRRVAASATSVMQPNLARPVRPYAMTATYEPGDRIAHPKFGEGVVESCPTESKMLVTFEGGRRILAQGKQGGPI